MLSWTKSAISTSAFTKPAVAVLVYLPAMPEQTLASPSSTCAHPAAFFPLYKIQAGRIFHGEIYPVFANYASLQRQGDRTFGVVSVTLSNTSPEPMSRRVSVRIPGWSDEEIQTVEIDSRHHANGSFCACISCPVCIKTMRSRPPRPR